jgi:hypothetical protein
MRCFLKNRKGAGVFVVLIGIILFSLFTFGVHNYLFVQRVSQDVSVVSLGGIATVLAESAVAEASAYISKKINTPGEMLFDKFRRQSGGMSHFDFDIAVPLSADIIANWPKWNFSLTDGKVKVKVLFQRAFNDLNYEKYGALKISAEVKVRSGFTTLVKRSAETIREFKQVLVTTPRPFEQMTFYLNDITGYINPAEENGRIGASIDAINNNLPARRQTLIDELDRVASEYGADTSPLKNILISKPLNQSIPPLKNFPADFALFSTLPYLSDLRYLDVPTKIQEMEPGIQAAITRVQNATRAVWDSIVAAIDASDQSASGVYGPMTEFADATKELSELHVERLNYYSIFQSQTGFATGGLKTRLNNFFAKFGTMAEWKAKAFHLIDENIDDINTAFSYIMSEYQPLNGIVFVNNPSQALRIENVSIFGKLIVVTSGDIELNNVVPYRNEEHLFTAISYGEMRLSGVVGGSLCPMNGYKIATVSSSLKGNMVLPKVFDSTQFKGNLSYNEFIFSGTTTTSSDSNAKLPYYFMGLGPRTVNRNFSRSQSSI